MQVSLFVTSILFNIQTVPGILWGSFERLFADRQSGRMRALDVHGMTHELILAVFQYNPLLYQTDEIAIETVNCVDRVVFGSVYDSVFEYFVSESQSADDSLASKLAGVGEVPRAHDLQAMRSLASLQYARTSFDKMKCVTRFVEVIASPGLAADDLIPALCRSVLVGINHLSLRIFSELAFMDYFSRGDVAFYGKDGYSLTSLSAAVDWLARTDIRDLSRLCCDECADENYSAI